MSVFDNRRASVGLQTQSRTASSTSSGGGSFASRRAEMKKKDDEDRAKALSRSQTASKPQLSPQDSIMRSKPSTSKGEEMVRSVLQANERTFPSAQVALTPTINKASGNTQTEFKFTPEAGDPFQRRQEELLGKTQQQLGKPLGTAVHYALEYPISALGDIVKPATDIAEKLYTPGAGITAINAGTQAVGGLLARYAPKIGYGSKVLPTMTREAIKEAAVGAPIGAGQVLAANPGATGEEVLKGAGLGAAYGAGGGALLAGAGKLAGSLRNTALGQAGRLLGNQLQQSGAIEQVGREGVQLDNAVARLADIDDQLTSLNAAANKGPDYNDQLTLLTNDRNQTVEYIRRNDPNFNAPEQPLIRVADDGPASGSPDIPASNPVADITQEAENRVQNSGGFFNNLFNNLFGEQNIGFTPFGSSRSNRIVTTEQQIVNNPLKQTTKGLLGSTKQAGRSTYHGIVDYLDPLKKISPQAYEAAMDSARANNIANSIIKDKFVDNQGIVIGGSLNDIMKVTRGLGKKVDDYLILRHAITRMERGEAVYDTALEMTADKARKAVETMESRYPQLKKVGQDWDSYNANLLDSGVREGLISESARDAMRQANPNYAAMRRQFNLGEKMSAQQFGGSASAFSGQKAPIKAVSPTGSTRRIVSPLRSAMEQTYAWKNAELRNRTMQEIVKAIQADPDGMKGIAEVIKKPNTSYKSLDEALREGGSEEFLELLDNDFKSLFKKGASGEENIVRAMIKGNPVFVKVHDPESVSALLGLGGEQSGLVLAVAQKLSDATKRGATGLFAPMFAIKSLGGDTIQAAIQSPNAVQHILSDFPAALMSTLGDMLKIPGMGKLAQEFRRAGGEYSALLRGDRRVNARVGQLRREPFLTPKGIAKGVGKTITSPFKALEKVANASENVNRMAAYRRALKGKERTPENVRNAINAARESTVNFSRRGSLSRQFEAVSPYTNAAVQGVYKTIKQFKDHPIKTTAGLTTLVLAPKLYEFARFHDDPDYQKIPARERYRHIIYDKNADGTFKKQFIEPSYNAFGAFMTDVLEYVVDNDPDAFKGALSSIVNAYTPPLVSGALQGATQGGGPVQSVKGAFNASVLAPASAIASNQSFTGAPIVPQRLQNRSPQNQYDERTSNLSKLVGEKIGMSPMHVDYLLRAYGGDPARLILPLFSDVGGGTPRNTLLKNFIVDPVFTNSLSDDYYTGADRLAQAKADHEQVGDPLPEWYTEDLYKLANSRANGMPAKRLSDLNALKREVTGDKKIGAQEKADKLRDIQKQINEVYLEVNTKLEGANVPLPRR